MLNGFNSTLPIDTFIPWAFLFASALLATCVDAFARKPFNPVTVCVWFFGVTFSGTLGDWGLSDQAAAVVCLISPHLLISVVAPRLARPEPAPAAEPTEDVDPPQRLVVVRNQKKHTKRVPLRRAA